MRWCGLTGTHLGCEHGACGACTVLLDGQAVRSCLIFAVQVDGQEVTTVEGIASPDGELSPVQAALKECHGLQCGFCTPGFVTSITALLRDNPKPTDEEIREGLSGNFCRCTGYQGIVNAVHRAAEMMEPTSALERCHHLGDAAGPCLGRLRAQHRRDMRLAVAVGQLFPGGRHCG